MSVFLEEIQALNAAAESRLVVNEAPPRTLYHYTDAAGLIGTLSARAIWATDARFLNDTTELSFVREIVASAAASVELQSAHAKELVAKLLRVEPWEIFMGSVYVASFSTKRDLLSQWRAYGGDGLGYAIGVDTRIALEPLHKMTPPPEDPDLKFYPKVERYSKVVYDINGPGGILWETVVGMIRALDAVEAESGEARADLVHTTILDLMRSIYPTVKNAGFAEEDEWRLIFESHAAGGFLEPLHFRPNGRGISPYVSLRWDEPPVVEVVLGPRIPKSEGEQALWMLMLATEHSAGCGEIKPKLTHSEVSYRR